MLQNPEQIYDVAIEVVVQLGVRPRLLHQHASSTAERLDVACVRRKVLQHPRRNPELGAVVPDDRGGDGHIEFQACACLAGWRDSLIWGIDVLPRYYLGDI